METLNTLFKKNLWKSIVIIFLICTISLITLEGAWCDKEVLKKFIEEIIIVVGAAVVVSLYFEFLLLVMSRYCCEIFFSFGFIFGS